MGMDVYLGRKRLLCLVAVSMALIMVLAFGAGCGGGKKEGGTEGKRTEPETGLTWPTEYRENQRTGRSEKNAPDTGEVKWIYEAGAQTRAWSVLDKEGNVIAGFQGKVVSVIPEGGTLAWEFPTGAGNASTCCVGDDGTIYASAGNSVYSLSSKGIEKWSYDLGSEADEPALGKDGTVYVGSISGRLVALDKNGKLKWDQKVPGNIRSPSLDKSSNLYCSAAPLVMYAFDKNGKQKWEFKPEGDLPLHEGMFSWANTLDVPSIGDDGTVYVGSFVSPGITTAGQQIPGYAMPSKGKLYAVTAQGVKKWEYVPQFDPAYTIHTPSIGRDGTLYAGTSCWRVIALHPDGTTKWEFHTGEGQDVCPSVYSPSIGRDGLLYAATTSAKIFCITPEGTEKWRFAAEDPWLPGMSGSNNFTPPPIGDDGTLFSVLAQGRIYAFKPPASVK